MTTLFWNEAKASATGQYWALLDYIFSPLPQEHPPLCIQRASHAVLPGLLAAFVSAMASRPVSRKPGDSTKAAHPRLRISDFPHLD